MQLPDYREIELPISIASLKNYIEPLLYQTGVIKRNEELIDIKTSYEASEFVWIKICLKKHQEIDLITT